MRVMDGGGIGYAKCTQDTTELAGEGGGGGGGGGGFTFSEY